jgi:hypothetical protein
VPTALAGAHDGPDGAGRAERLRPAMVLGLDDERGEGGSLALTLPKVRSRSQPWRPWREAGVTCHRVFGCEMDEFIWHETVEPPSGCVHGRGVAVDLWPREPSCSTVRGLRPRPVRVPNQVGHAFHRRSTAIWVELR